MKKILSILLAAALLFCAAGCDVLGRLNDVAKDIDNKVSGTSAEPKTAYTASPGRQTKESNIKTVPLELGVRTTAGSECAFTLQRIRTTDFVCRTGGTDGFECGSEGDVFVDMTVIYENTSSEPADISKAASVMLTVDGSEYPGNVCAAVTQNGVTSKGTIAAGAKTVLHVACEVPNGTNTYGAVLKIGGKAYEKSYTIGSVLEKKRAIDSSHSLFIEGIVQMDYAGYAYGDTILPSDTKNAFSKYVVEDPDNYTYLAIKTDYTNLSDKPVDPESVISSCVYIEGYRYYNCTAAAESADGTRIEKGSQIAAGEKRRVFLIAKVKKDQNGRSGECRIAAQGREYYITFGE